MSFTFNYGPQAPALVEFQIGSSTAAMDFEYELNGQRKRVTTGFGSTPKIITAGTQGPTKTYDIAVPFVEEPAVTRFLCHFDGANNATTTTDATGLSTVALTDGSKLSTASPLFGSAALSFPVQGAYCLISDSSFYNPLADDWTFEFWIKGTTFANLAIGAGFFAIGSNTLQFYSGLGGHTSQSLPALNPAAWTHVAIVRRRRHAMVFHAGVRVLLLTNEFATGEELAASANVQLYHNGTTVDTFAIDEFRLRLGKALYTANFTPPASAFTS
jgi:hypothetical protein